MFKKIVISLGLFTFFLISMTSAKTSSSEPPLFIPQLEGHIKIDSQLNEEQWKKAVKLDLKYETEPAENTPAPVKTDVYVFHDKNNIYFALVCYDPNPNALRARYSQRDQGHLDDVININLDTFNDERRNYYFGCNPLGVQREGIESSSVDSSWDAIWNCSGKITKEGYIIEIAIPFSSLQFHNRKGPKIWGLDISRWYQRDFRHRCGLVKIDRNNNSYQSQFLKITGFENIKPGKNIEIMPTLTGIKTDIKKPFPDGKFYKETQKFDPGLTVKWGLTTNLVLNGTIKPDFSQVEADSRQLDINQPFALYYEEKRPFFTEGSDFFSSPLRIIYTRSLRSPLWGLKLSGKEGKNTVGAYLVQDDITNIIFPGAESSSQVSLDDNSLAAILRYKRDFGSRYTIGALFTNRESGDYFNRVYGIDTLARITPRNKIQVQLLGTSTRYSTEIAKNYNQPENTFSDNAFLISYNYNSRNVNAYSGYKDFGENFRSDLGYNPKVGYRTFYLGSSYRWLKNNSFWAVISPEIELIFSRDSHNNLLDETQTFYMFIQGKMQSYINIEANHSRTAYNGKVYPLYYASFNTNFQPHRDIWINFTTQFGDRIDYDNSRKGKRLRFYTQSTINFGRHVNLSLSHNYEKMKVNNLSLYTANIFQGTLMYHFNTRIFLRSIIQYVNYLYNTENYLFPVDPKFKTLFTQFLFSYQLNPRTVLFLGYSDNYQGLKEYSLTQKNRTLFMKVGYSWQL